MPFQPIQSMLSNPTIRIFFHGLIIVRSPDGVCCLAELHHDNDETHTLSVEVRAKTEGQADIVLMRHSGYLSGGDVGLSINVTKGTSDPAAYKYVPTRSFDPRNPIHGERDDDFRWVINLESENFHGRELEVKTPKTRPGVRIENGVCYLYTARIKKGDIEVFQGYDPKWRLKGIASVVGANLYLDDEGEAVVTCHRGDAGDFVLPIYKPTDNRVSYEIYIDNSPLFEPPSAPASHSELKEYYKVLKEKASTDDIPEPEQFNLVFLNEGEEALQRGSSKYDTLFSSIRIPCMSTTLDG